MASYLIISVPNQGSPEETFKKIKSKTSDLNLSSNFKFDIPIHELKKGTLDQLVMLSDEIVKHDSFIETVLHRIERTITDLIHKGDIKGDLGLFVERQSPISYFLHWTWAREKYPIEYSLNEIVKRISEDCTKIDEDLRIRFSKLQECKTSILTMQRQNSGTLQTKSLHPYIRPEDIIEGEYLTTVMVIVPLNKEALFIKTYEFFELTPGSEKDKKVIIEQKETKELNNIVVPRSAKKLAEDGEFLLYRVVIFRKGIDSFRTQAKKNMLTVREFHYDPDAMKNNATMIAQLEGQKNILWGDIINWCRVNFAEVFIGWLHIKAIRVFAESVLLYGLPLNFSVIIMKPAINNEQKLREALQSLFSHLSTPGLQDEEDYPYVSIPLNISSTFC